jgi:hypothetical protein
MKKLMFTLAGITAVVLLAGVAYAGVPCAGTSSVNAAPPCGAYCPASDFDIVTVTVVVRDCYGTPLEGEEVLVEPTDLVTHYFCLGEEAKTCTTDVTGTCVVYFHQFGGCDDKLADCGLEFTATASGVVLGPSNRIVTASPDTDATGKVDLSDFIYFAGVYQSTTDCCCDFDCTGKVDLSDFIAFANHYQHKCPELP